MFLEPAPLCGSIGVIVLGAGKSERMHGPNKIFAPLDGHPLIVHSLHKFTMLNNVQDILLVLSKESWNEGISLVERYGWKDKIRLCTGGILRQDSVAAGLEELRSCVWVIIHDGARPMISMEILDNGMKAALETGAAIAAVPTKDTIKVVSRNRVVNRTISRKESWQTQTPQIFRYELIREAHRRSKGSFPDDSAMVEKMKHPVKIFMGAYSNIKITTPGDLTIANTWMGKPLNEVDTS